MLPYTFSKMSTLISQVKDKTDAGTSGEVQIINGGISTNFVNFRFTSEWSKGMSYHIDIYSLSNVTYIIDDSFILWFSVVMQ